MYVCITTLLVLPGRLGRIFHPSLYRANNFAAYYTTYLMGQVLTRRTKTLYNALDSFSLNSNVMIDKETCIHVHLYALPPALSGSQFMTSMYRLFNDNLLTLDGIPKCDSNTNKTRKLS